MGTEAGVSGEAEAQGGAVIDVQSHFSCHTTDLYFSQSTSATATFKNSS